MRWSVYAFDPFSPTASSDSCYVGQSSQFAIKVFVKVERARPPLLDFKTNNTKQLLVTLIFNNPTLSPRRILQLYGMKLALDTISIRELRTMFGTYNRRSWYR